MGRNFYLVTMSVDDIESDLKEAMAYVSNLQLIAARHQLEDILDQIRLYERKRIHIGKSSTGGFSFDYQNCDNFSTREEMDAWLKSGKIIDEDEDVYTFDEFWAYVHPFLDKDTTLKNGDTEGQMIRFGLPFSSNVGFC